MAELKWLVNTWNYYYFKDAPVHATGVSLDKSSIAFTSIWQTEQLTATVTPDDAVYKKVSWTSSNTSVATVSNTWLVTLVWEWNCTITVTTLDWGYTATCNVILQTNKVIDFLLVWWWWGWWYWRGSYNCWAWWWWAWWLIYCTDYELSDWSYSVIIWAWWNRSNWWDSCALWCIAVWWWFWWDNYNGNYVKWQDWWSWWGWIYYYWLWNWTTWQWNSWWSSSSSAAWWGWWWIWWAGWAGSSWNWWTWWLWCLLTITWANQYYASWWGWWSNSTPWHSYHWWWCWWWYNNGYVYATNATTYWSWWWWGWLTSACKWWNWCQWIFILRYPTSCWYSITWWTKYTCGDYTIHCFTSNWTLTVS